MLNSKGEPMIAFPYLHRQFTLEWAPVIGLSIVACVLLVPCSWTLASIAAIPCLLFPLQGIRLGILNNRLRYQWAQSFSLRLTNHQLREKLRAEPNQYIVHLGYYGGFDTAPAKPVGILEDRITGELAALPRASERLPRLCEQLGVEITQTSVSPFPPT